MARACAPPLPRPHRPSRIRQHHDRDALGGAGVEEVRVGGREWGVEGPGGLGGDAAGEAHGSVAAAVVTGAEQAGADGDVRGKRGRAVVLFEPASEGGALVYRALHRAGK